MEPEKITGTAPKLKRRAGVIPTRKERDRKNEYRRDSKHRSRERAMIEGRE